MCSFLMVVPCTLPNVDILVRGPGTNTTYTKHIHHTHLADCLVLEHQMKVILNLLTPVAHSTGLTRPISNQTCLKSLELPSHRHIWTPTPNEHTHTTLCCSPYTVIADSPMTNSSGKRHCTCRVCSSPCKALCPNQDCQKENYDN